MPDLQPIVVLPLDGSDLAARARGLAMEITRRVGGRLVVVGAPEVYGMDLAWYGGATPDFGVPMVPITELMQQARDATSEFLAGQQRAIAVEGVAVDTAMIDDMPARAIVQAAESRGAWLIVMATHGLGGLSRWALGSVADKVLQTAPAPVLLVRAGAPHVDPSLEHILVPLDGSGLAEAILPDVERLARAFGSRVTLASVSLEAKLALESASMLEAQQQAVERMTAYLSEHAARLAAAGVAAAVEMLAGDDAASALLERTARGDVDLIALTTHGRGGLSRWSYGSVADRLIRSAEMPVLVRRSVEA